jgi:hypothetical protein
MNSRLRCLAVVLAAILILSIQLAAQIPAAKGNPTTKGPPDAKSTTSIPRLPDGKPDLGGYWSNNTVTPLERPMAFAGREFLTDEEARALEDNSKRDDNARVKGGAGGGKAGPGGVGDYNAVFLEDSQRVLANKRTSIITDPKDGKMPPLTPEAQRKFDADEEYHKQHPHDGPEDMTTIERCITWISSGPPMLPTFYNNNYQIIQTHDQVMILAEMIHDVRIIPLDGRPHEDIHQWVGDSRGHWEGDTLVVETINFNGKRGWFGTPMVEGGGGKRPDTKMRVIERFTRTRPDILLYQFTIDDPGTYTKPWSGEIPMRMGKDPVYEYACHEGNYAMVDILVGARSEEKESAEAAKKGAK